MLNPAFSPKSPHGCWYVVDPFVLSAHKRCTAGGPARLTVESCFHSQYQGLNCGLLVNSDRSAWNRRDKHEIPVREHLWSDIHTAPV